MLTWKIEKQILGLKYTWKISRNASDTKTNLFVSVTDGIHTGKGEVAPNIRYEESPEKAEQEFLKFQELNPGLIKSVEELGDLLERFDVSHSLRFGIESAYIHFHCARQKISVPEYLGILPGNHLPVSFSIPIMEIGRIKSFYQENNLQRFPFIKAKVNAEEFLDNIKNLTGFCHQPLIIDANEAFTDVEHCIRTLEKIKGHRIEIIEQPMPAAMKEESVYLKKHASFPLIADESVTDEADFAELASMFDGINMKLMKAGGYLNGIRLLREAKKAGMKTMVGCMVETTLGISSGMHCCSLADYVDLDSFLVIKNEPFGLVTEKEGILTLAPKNVQ